MKTINRNEKGMKTINRACLVVGACTLLIGAGRTQDLDERVKKLEQHREQVDKRIGSVVDELQRLELGDVVRPLGEGRNGLGPAASKVYGVQEGLSIGGYGEFLFRSPTYQTDVMDALRAVIYFGFKFNDEWLVNTEIEVEHATTSTSSGTTSSGGSVSLEFGSVEWTRGPELNARAGLLLVPMGLINELHEPTTFLPALRPETEQRIIPTTWREVGVGVFGEVEGFSYRAYLVNGLDGENFSAAGLRGGRQKGNRAAADDLAGVARVDWVGTPGLTVGGSVYYGRSGQDGRSGPTAIPGLDTLIVEGHATYQAGPLHVRGLVAMAKVDGAGQFNTATGAGLAERMHGHYIEVGFDVLAQFAPQCNQSLTPYFRYEHIDTQAKMPAGFVKDSRRDQKLYTLGGNWKPIEQVVVKVECLVRDPGEEQVNVLLGYVF